MRFGDTFAAVLIVWMVVSMGFLVVGGWSSTGPHCPGKNPSWIGFCEDAPE